MNNPMTQEDYKTINGLLKLIQDAIPWIQRAEDCGEDCQEIKGRIEEHRTKLEKIKKTYFKNGKPLWT